MGSTPWGSGSGVRVSDLLCDCWELGEVVGAVPAEDVPAAVGEGVWEFLWVGEGALVQVRGTDGDYQRWVIPVGDISLPDLSADG